MSESCKRCKSRRLARIVAKCSDMFSMGYMGKSYHGDVPSCEIGSGDYIEFEYCLGCGQIQGAFPEDEPECYPEPGEGGNYFEEGYDPNES